MRKMIVPIVSALLTVAAVVSLVLAAGAEMIGPPF
jgi:hypothetical protein